MFLQLSISDDIYFSFFFSHPTWLPPKLAYVIDLFNFSLINLLLVSLFTYIRVQVLMMYAWCSGAEYVRKEIPLHVLPTASLLKLESPLTSFTDLQRVLYEEERAAYTQAILQHMRYLFDAKLLACIFLFFLL